MKLTNAFIREKDTLGQNDSICDRRRYQRTQTIEYKGIYDACYIKIAKKLCSSQKALLVMRLRKAKTI